MLLSWKSVEPEWELCLGPADRLFDQGRAGCNAGSNSGIPGCYCMLHIRPEEGAELPSRTIILCALPWGTGALT
jgi:hypothetical protein